MYKHPKNKRKYIGAGVLCLEMCFDPKQNKLRPALFLFVDKYAR